MPFKSRKNGFDSLDINPDHQVRKPDISDSIQQTIARLFGWWRGGEQFRLVEIDQDGRLLVSTSPTQGSTWVNSNPTVGVTASAILNQNTSRRQYIIENLGTADIYIGGTSAVTTATGLKIPSGGIFADDVYTGALYAISGTAGQDVRVVEM